VGNPWPVRVGDAAREAAGGRGTGKGAAGRGSGTRGDEARATGLDGRAARRLPSGASLGALGNERDKPIRREEDEPAVKGERKVVSGKK
jgi:hypothetical protein